MTYAIVIGLLAAGTFALRLSGVVLRDRVNLPDGVRRLLPLAAVALLGAFAATAALTTGTHSAGVARPLGVFAGLLAAVAKLPFVAVVVIAAATAAGLRLLGMP